MLTSFLRFHFRILLVAGRYVSGDGNKEHLASNIAQPF